MSNYWKEWNLNNPDYYKEYYINNKERLDKYHHDWVKDNYEKNKIYQSLYRKEYYKKHKVSKQQRIEKELEKLKTKAEEFKNSLKN